MQAVSVCGTHREMALVTPSMIVIVWDSRGYESSFPEGDPRPTAEDLFAWDLTENSEELASGHDC